MKKGLTAFYLFVLAAMCYGTVAASADRGVITAIRELWPDPWMKVTLYDAYFAFLTFYLWVAYREKSFAARAVWFVLIMLLGNFAIAAYMLLQLRRLGSGASVKTLLTGDKEN